MMDRVLVVVVDDYGVCGGDCGLDVYNELCNFIFVVLFFPCRSVSAVFEQQTQQTQQTLTWHPHP